MKTRIYQPHTHAGTRHVPGPDGLDIDLPADAIAWLKANSPAVLERPKAVQVDRVAMPKA